MRGSSRGSGGVQPVIALDRAPEGWWVSLEAVFDDNGRHVVIQKPSAHLFPSPGDATGTSLAAAKE